MHTSNITKVIQETHDTYSLQFKKPTGFKFKPGQYGLFEHNSANEIVKRSYSFSSSPTEKFLQITLKHMPHGKMSGYLTALHAKDVLTYTAPLGNFTFNNSVKNVVFIAGGSGISPLRSMVKQIVDKKSDVDMIFIYGCRSPHDIILKEELDKFNRLDNFHLFLTVDHPDDGWKFHTGFIDGDFIIEAAHDVSDKVFYICGPPVMVESIRETLLKLHVQEENIRVEEWG